MSRGKKRTPRLTPEAQRELDALAERILAGDEALEIWVMQKVYGKPVETVEPLPFKPIENDSPIDQEPGT